MNRKQRRTAAAHAHQSYVLGHACHSKGDLEGAKAHYLRAASAAPAHSGVLLGLGLIAFKSGLLADAEEFLRRASEADPKDANILSNLSAVLLTSGQFSACAEAAERALKAAPATFDAYVNLSHARRQMGEREAALAAARRAVELKPGNAKANAALAAALKQDKTFSPGELDEAITALTHARGAAPRPGTQDYPLAEMLIERGKAGEALKLLEDHAGSGELHPEYHRVLGRAHFALQNFNGALAAANRHLALEPDAAIAHAQRALALCNLYRYEEALVSFKESLSRDPDHHKLKLDMCQIRQSLCDWDGLEEAQQDIVRYMRETESISGPFHVISIAEPAGSAESQLHCAQIYQKRLLPSLGAIAPPQGRRTLNSKLKIGYLSNDYRDHATASLMSELIERHDKSRFEISAYCYSPDDASASRQRLKAAFDRFIDINAMTTPEAAATIRRDGIDILVDLKGYTQGSRTAILAHRPAPIQINYLGYPGTLGADYVDYIIGDEFLTPMSSAAYYSEKIVQLPHCYQPNDTQRPAGNFFIRREDFGLPRDAFVFCSFNNPNKLTRPVFEIWMRLLQQVPGSVFWIYVKSASAQANLLKEAVRCGVDPGRIVFAGFADVELHIARMRLGDLFLDAFPCTAHTTASEALWAGLPLVTCAGNTFASRVAGSILRSANMTDLITDNLADYEALALALAQDRSRLAAVRARAQQAVKTPLFDIATYTRDLELALAHMAETYTRGEAPAAFAVRDLIPQSPQIPTEDIPTMSFSAAEPIIIDFGIPAQAEHLRITYSGCPLCQSDDCMQMGKADCTGHALYKSSLPGTIDWNLCRSCRHVFASGYFGEEGLLLLHPTTPLSERAGHDVERKRQTAAKVVQRIARIARAGTWLDVGFGDASVLFAAEEWGYHPVGLDLRADNVQALNDLGIEAHEACIELHEGNETCSVVSMVNLLQHVPFPGSAIAHAARLLKPGGALFIVAPNMDSMLWRMMDRDRQNPFWKDIEIYHQFTRKRLYELLVENGLMPVEYNVSEKHRASMEVLAMKPARGT